MGTNYYWYEKPPCECCGRAFEPLHIGKSSAGWCFALHVYPDDGINTLEDWLPKIGKLFSWIEDEYGKKIKHHDLIDIITLRTHGKPKDPSADLGWYIDNHAVLGPNGLARGKIDGRHCIGHGEGTWDYYIGDFS